MSIRVTIWNEFRHEKTNDEARRLYPCGIHATIKSFLESDDITVTLAALDDPNQGIDDELLNSTDVLIWWGHMAHGEVSDSLANKITQRVYGGMGFIPLHSAHKSKPFCSILGTTGNLTWGRVQRAIVWNLSPNHPITEGIPAHFEITDEMYGEPFFIPKPDELLFGTWYEDGNIFRGGATFERGLGRIFYFHPGHETAGSFHNSFVQKIITNAVHWCAPRVHDSSFDGMRCIKQTDPIFFT